MVKHRADETSISTDILYLLTAGFVKRKLQKKFYLAGNELNAVVCDLTLLEQPTPVLHCTSRKFILN
jgi:hypothetical protein